MFPPTAYHDFPGHCKAGCTVLVFDSRVIRIALHMPVHYLITDTSSDDLHVPPQRSTPQIKPCHHHVLFFKIVTSSHIQLAVIRWTEHNRRWHSIEVETQF